MPTLSIVIVSFGSAAALAETLPALARELRDGDEVIVVDNGSTDASAEIAREYAHVIENAGNAGFPTACNQGAARAQGDVIVFLNPDAVPQPGWGEAIRRPWERGWTAWQALVTSGGDVNSSGNPVHFTGITWAGQEPAQAPREVSSVSGACFAVRADDFRAVGGFHEPFFLYHEDVDLSLRLRLRGGVLGIEPDARVEHDYEFHKGAYKWRLLERNRWYVLLRCWPGALLALVAPALVLTELAVWAAALAGGWAPEKARASGEVLRALPRLLRERREVQGTRRIDAAQFAAHLTPDLTSPLLGRAAQSALIGGGLRVYWGTVRRLLQRQATTSTQSSVRPQA